ncbi:UNVERIFIED_CONTAM: hypothetical protein RMT77_009911 [Armadillidium vulgare]
MEKFNSSKASNGVFKKDLRLREMEGIREQQERLAKLHFDFGADMNLHSNLSSPDLRMSEKKMKTLMEKLAELSESIENLQN